VKDLATGPGHLRSVLNTLRDDDTSKIGNFLALGSCRVLTLFIKKRLLVSIVVSAYQMWTREAAGGFTHIIAPPNCRMAALEVVDTLSLTAGSRAWTQMKGVRDHFQT
jgi:hypothetical protein